MSKSSDKKKLPTLSKKKKVIALVTAIIILLALVATGWLQYGVARLACGKQPVIYNELPITFVSAASYYVIPGYAHDPEYKIHFFTRYYCDEQQAIADGKRIDPLSGAGIERIKAEDLERRQNPVTPIKN